MNIQIQSLLLGQGTNFRLKAPVEGLEEPDQRNSSFVYSGRDGGSVTDQFYGMRPITITGTIVSPSCEQHEIDRKLLTAALPIRTDLVVILTTFTGVRYRLIARRMQLDMPLIAQDYSEFKIELLCDDHLIYEENGAASLEVTVGKPSAGGYVTPYVLPVIWEDSQDFTNVVNNGDTIIYPVIEFSGTAINPLIRNSSTGEEMQVNITLVAGDSLIIDMKERTITLNGGSVLGTKDPASTWWGLQPGTNLVGIETDGGSDTGEATVRWYNGFTGI